jgi:hypothetical protein
MTSKRWQPYWSSDIRPTNNQWAKLEQDGGITLSPEQRDRLANNMTVYREDADGLAAAIAPGALRPRLEVLLNALTQVVAAAEDLLSKEGHPTYREIRIAAALRFHQVADAAQLEKLMIEIRRWGDYADAAVQSLPQGPIGKNEQTPDAAGLIVTTLDIFRAAGGSGNQSAAAIRFVRGVCRLAGYQAQSDQSDEAVRSLINRSVRKATQNSKA